VGVQRKRKNLRHVEAKHVRGLWRKRRARGFHRWKKLKPFARGDRPSSSSTSHLLSLSLSLSWSKTKSTTEREERQKRGSKWVGMGVFGKSVRRRIDLFAV